ncbi:hypothetical protein BO221_39105 [Archangium sp. Cb G35]|uniref:hypothetical protein n=1 Tax=Archangium sp. Cb G35 TaxID=1920190 RepID=UPI000936E818|nr:hypothetical protein [Archangium sp. Cb G35]OJT18746.1 hypothetical protein BO221_39105 [Archangium sp. Cb G35]
MAEDRSFTQRILPGDGLLHPLVFASVALLVVNDHVFKLHCPSWWTGKLSDVAGLAFFPLLLQGLWEVVTTRRERPFLPSVPVLLTCVVLTGVVFSTIQVWDVAGLGWQWGLGSLQWPVRALGALWRGAHVPHVAPVAHTADVGDLLTLPALGLPLWLGRARCYRGDEEQEGRPSP